MAQAVVSIYVEKLKHCVQHVLGEFVACGNRHSSLELGCREKKKKKKIYVWKIGRKLQTDLTDRETVPMPTGRLASVTIFIEKAKSSRLLVNRQKALNSSNAILYKRKHDS